MKKVLIFYLMTIYSCNCVFAQFSIGKSSSQLMIEKSIADALYIVAQDYQLYDTIAGEKYGKNNKQQFNTIYSLGIGINSRLITNDRVLNPSKYDNQYEKYKLKYKAINSDLLVRHLNDSTIKFHSLKEDLPKGMFFSENKKTSSQFGWLIIASSSNPDKSDKVDITAYVKSIRCDIDTLIDVSEWGADNVLGGFYMIPSYEKPGEIKFHIVSYLKERIDNKWLLTQLVSINPKEENFKSDTSSSDNNSTDDVLTPISSGKDKKKPSKTKKKK